MPKLKFTKLSVMPLCLKLRGRIVGAVSRSRIKIYIASGLLLLSSILLIVILISLQADPIGVAQPEEQVEILIEKAVAIPAQHENTLREVKPELIPKQDALIISPTIKGPIQVDFGWQFQQIYKDWRYHTGVDIGGSVGQAVEAFGKGQVEEIIHDSSNGLTVVVKNNESTIYYASLAEVKVSKGSQIEAGQTIGIMGSCDAEPYPHLHLAIQKKEEYIDPKLVIKVQGKE